jgi:hypothetical protein
VVRAQDRGQDRELAVAVDLELVVAGRGLVEAARAALALEVAPEARAAGQGQAVALVAPVMRHLESG